MSVPGVAGLAEVVRALRGWQHDEAPPHLHPGDVGWHLSYGTAATAGALRVWRRNGTIVAVGLLDSPDLVRLAIAPDVAGDEELARRMVDDVSRPGRGVLPSGSVAVEARGEGAFRALLLAAGWQPDEAWTPLRRDLTGPVEGSGLRVEVVGPEQVAARVAVQRAAFDRSTFTARRWHAMAAGSPYADACCLVGYDTRGAAVAVVTVWSAGPGRPGLLEPMGVHRDHRGHGHGTAICVAAAATLREMGASGAVVATPSGNVGAVATYRSAGFRQLPEVRDLRRPALG
ncbi:GNAT family N-acetyltransferase [Micromonospora sp. WMMD882]|uniref:GNAT family N-acetyltransferase n=1 Tax=Micromonospora sp. WMMD882 TaxID=3015151 RepID=UPI00248CF134|nr:GNAT family N-acetyltransferase [Micromonospora sp. WMMD882]WBB80424.1 GNAT family N-acetyltransferase [Micromonospora sp. WMMD882]